MPRSLKEAPRVLDDLVLYRLSRLSATAGSAVVRLCEGRFGITRREWRVILQLAETGGLQSSELAQQVQLDRARTSRTVSSLVAKQLVHRAVRPGDRRRVSLMLTEAGQALHASLFPLVAHINVDLLSVLSQEQLQRFEEMLQLLRAQADRIAARDDLPRLQRHRGGRGRARRGDDAFGP
ncbi:MAG: MarR family transcriptional regulator [Betaproteobacteria bacterium]|jgi:DNA-binding MarR family transcriptional regulator|nr:MarR family transcriptional regulator [Betaproteobacteria bacterium]NBS46033.1 MarR family transcriptional regulator [Betaproteobacteria bacterium]